MKKLAVCMMLVLGVAVVAQAQCETDNLLEKVLVIQFAQEAGLETYDMVDLLAGYEQYRDQMDGLEKARADAKAALEAAVAAGASAELSAKADALLDADEAIADAKRAAISEAGSLLSAVDAAKLCLLVSDLPAAKAALKASLAPKPAMPCPMAAAAAAAAPCDAPAAAAAPVATPEEEVMAVINEIIAAVKVGDVEKLLGFVSKDFYHSEVGDIEAVKEYIQMGKDAGYLDDVPAQIEAHDGQISLEDAEVEIKDGEATIYPIDASANEGSITLEVVMKKEDDGKWRIVGGDVFGI